jgi:hypothetical protein
VLFLPLKPASMSSSPPSDQSTQKTAHVSSGKKKKPKKKEKIVQDKVCDNSKSLSTSSVV